MPVAEASLEESNQNLNRALRRELPPEIVLDNAEGALARQTLAARMVAGVHREFEASDIYFGYRYRSELIVADPTETDTVVLPTLCARGAVPAGLRVPADSAGDPRGRRRSALRTAHVLVRPDGQVAWRGTDLTMATMLLPWWTAFERWLGLKPCSERDQCGSESPACGKSAEGGIPPCAGRHTSDSPLAGWSVRWRRAQRLSVRSW